MKYIQIYIFVLLFTTLLYFLENKSNISNYIIIPIIVSMTTKYLLGDFDLGYRYTFNDVLYWFYIILSSISQIYALDYYFGM